MFKVGISALVLGLASGLPVAAQTASPIRTLSAHEIAAQLDFDEFRVKQMQKLIATVDPTTIDDILLQHMNDKTKTVIDYGSKKVFVEYTSLDGKYYAWNPNDDKVKLGTWKIETDDKDDKTVCFQGDSDAKATCIPAAYILSEYCTIQLSNKDSFALMSGRVPYEKEILEVPGLQQ